MMAILNWRVWAAVALTVGMAVTHSMAYKTGRAMVRADWDKDIATRTAQALAASEAARAKEQALQAINQKVSAEYEAEKKRRAADRAVNAGRLSELQAAISGAASSDPATPGGIDDPRGAIINQCSSALVRLDDYAQGLASKAIALQDYARQVCVN